MTTTLSSPDSAQSPIDYNGHQPDLATTPTAPTQLAGLL
jgi:hypothetical protein